MKWMLSIIAGLLPAIATAGPHTVQRGETFEDIAAIYNISVDSLRKANPGTEAYTGYTVEVPVHSLVYDLGDSDLFKIVRLATDREKAGKKYRSGLEKQYKLGKAKLRDIEKKEGEITELYLEAAHLGSTEALYQLGRYMAHGSYDSKNGYPNFDTPLTEDIRALTKGVEYLQIAAVVGKDDRALAELGVICGKEDSPIHNPYLCASILESCVKTQGESVRRLLCEMYETGYGVPVDYLRAYVYCPEKLLVVDNDGELSHREKLLEKIEALPLNLRNAKYGVGLKPKELLYIGLSHYQNEQIDDEGLFWLHRAAREGESDACWMLASVLAAKNSDNGKDYNSSSAEYETLYFARKASQLGNDAATEYLASYEEYQQQKKERELQKWAQERREKEERKARRRQWWANAIGTFIQTAAQGYMAYENYKMQSSGGGMVGTAPQMPISAMSNEQFMAHNNLAMQQIMQYTVNQTVADMTNTPMVPTDMSAVNLGTDMTPGSPLWMWGQQQGLNRMSNQIMRMSCERVAFYRQQADAITQQLMENPMQPIAGFVDIDGNYITAEESAAGRANAGASEEKESSYDKARKEYHSYYAEHYGYKRCPSCNGSGTCKFCYGSGVCENKLGGPSFACPNCLKVNDISSGKCGRCRGKGTVFGLKY